MGKTKLNKTRKFMRAAIATFGVSLIGIVTSVGVGIKKNYEIYKLADNNGYQEANAIYRQTEIEKLNEQLELQEITPKQYNSKIDSIKDLSVEYYLSSDDVSQQTKEIFADLKNDYNICSYTGGASGVIMLGSVITFVVFAEKEGRSEQKEKAEDESIPATEQ